MKFIITGATSFIGVELTHYALSMGDEVIAVCRKGSAGISKLGAYPNLKIVYSELSEYANLDNQIEKADVFINLAWEGTGHSGRDITDIQKDNIAHSLDAIKVAASIGCSLFVEAGSQAEYGTVLEKISETTPCNPFSEYGKAKLAVKEQGSKIANALGMKYLHLRIFSLYGEDDHPWTLVMSALDKMLKDESVDLSPCTQNWNYLYVKDAVEQIIGLCRFALNQSDFEHEVYNIASNDTRVLRDFVLKMKEISRSTSKLNFGVKVSTNLVSLQPDIRKTERDSGFTNYHSFEDVIERIVNKKMHSKPDIFEKINNFKTYAHVKSHMLYGNYNACLNPKISVIIPVYKRPELFEKSLLSVINQDCSFEYEIVVVDNNDCEGESPNLGIVKKHARPCLFYYRHEQNIGSYANLNRGIELARADYVSFCHDDDLFLPHALRVIWNLHLSNSEKCITSKFSTIEEDGTLLKSVVFPQTRFCKFLKERESYSVSLFDQFIWPTGLDICNLYNRKNLLELGGYNPAHHPSCDNALLASYTYYYGSVVNNVPSFLYRTGENASQTLWPLFADNHLHQRKCMAKKLPYPPFILKIIYMANYHMNIVQHRVFWNHEPKSLYLSVPLFERLIIKFIKITLKIKKYRPNITFFLKDKIKINILANSKF